MCFLSLVTCLESLNQPFGFNDQEVLRYFHLKESNAYTVTFDFDNYICQLMRSSCVFVSELCTYVKLSKCWSRLQMADLKIEGVKHVKMGNGCVPYYCYP